MSDMISYSDGRWKTQVRWIVPVEAFLYTVALEVMAMEVTGE